MGKSVDYDIDKIISFRNQGVTFKEIARLLGVSEPALSLWLKRRGVFEEFYACPICGCDKAVKRVRFRFKDGRSLG